MALIAIATYCTEENQKLDCLKKTISSLKSTVNFNNHRLIIVDNNSCTQAKDYLIGLEAISETMIAGNFGDAIKDRHYKSKVSFIYNGENIGTARAINKAWALREPGEHVVKMDDDIVINNHVGWLDEMEEAVRRDPLIGQIGLKRKDCWENVIHPDPEYKSELIQLQHVPGERWMIVEKANHIIGSCVLHSSALIDKAGALYQPSLYGYDDVIMSWRTRAAGFYSCFLPHVPIDHIDEGKTPYQDWKHKHSGEVTKEVIELCHAIWKKERSYYFPF